MSAGNARSIGLDPDVKIKRNLLSGNEVGLHVEGTGCHISDNTARANLDEDLRDDNCGLATCRKNDFVRSFSPCVQ